MIRSTEQSVRNNGFGGKYLGQSSKKWSQLQLWKCMKKIVQNKYVTFDDLLFNACSGDSEALKSLIKSNILSIQRRDGVPMVTTFSPLYFAAFERIVNVPQLKKGLDLLEKKADIGKDMEEVVKVEDELVKLQDSAGDWSAAAIKQRKELLYDKLIYLNNKLEKKEKDARRIENS